MVSSRGGLVFLFGFAVVLGVVADWSFDSSPQRYPYPQMGYNPPMQQSPCTRSCLKCLPICATNGTEDSWLLFPSYCSFESFNCQNGYKLKITDISECLSEGVSIHLY